MLYEHLKSYGLTKRGEIRKRLAKCSEKRLVKFLGSYQQIAAKRPVITKATAGATDIYPDSELPSVPTDVILPLSIYANKIYLHDGLLRAVYLWQELDSVHYVARFQSRESRVDYFRDVLAAEIEELLELRPFVEAGIVYLTPTEAVVPRRDPRALYAEDIYGPNGSMLEQLGEELPEVPPAVEAYCSEYLKVYPARYDGERLPKVLKQELTPTRMIAVSFDNDPLEKYYQLSTMTITDKEKRRFINRFDLTGQTPIDTPTFQNWVKGCRRQFLDERMQKLHLGLLLASTAGAKFITSLPVSRDLAVLNLNYNSPSDALDVATALLRLELPYFENASPAAIVKARQNELAFEEFRLAMDKAFDTIKALPNTSAFQEEVDLVVRDVLKVPVLKVEAQMKTLGRNLFTNGILVAGSLVGTILTNGNTLLAATTAFTTMAALKTYKQDKVEEDKIKQSPSFFYWQATRSK